MKTLWTPWRMEHVTGRAPKITGCLFEPPGEERSSKEYLLLFRDAHLVVLLNRFPYANGHLLLAPKRHINDLSQLTDQENLSLIKMISTSCSIITKILSPEGFNVGLNIGSIAGAGIPDHLHFHIVPRWEGDHNFMAVCADLRTIPQHIDATFDMLLPQFDQLPARK